MTIFEKQAFELVFVSGPICIVETVCALFFGGRKVRDGIEYETMGRPYDILHSVFIFWCDRFLSH